ncbi:hypothetical protein ACH5RR_038670 [Cinchona calisaya]|uniref:MSP domain-containing protein n=1 Tax=Cinchona calisaya TaxID=153742 RepID=A0ABD2Y185_9GENT
MSTGGELLNIDPLELKFPFELKKQISCSFQLSNKTENHVAFKVKTTNPKKYCVRPNTGIVLPRSICDVIVTMQAQKEAPADMVCRDKFLLQSAVASAGATPKDITGDMFNKESGNQVEECKLKVVYVAPPQPPSPVAEESEEGSSPRPSIMENGSLTGSEISRKFVDTYDRSSEARSVISKLTEEKAAAIQQSNKLRQELELLRHGSNKSQGGVSIVVVIVFGLLGVVLGYIVLEETSIGNHDKSSEIKSASGGRFLKIEPLELRFTFEPKKQISCYLYLSNSTDNYVAFKVLTSNVTNYTVQPNYGIILPQTACGITVKMQPQNEPPTGMQCKDKFKIQTVLLGPCADLTNITKSVFNKEEGYSMEEYKLPVIYLSAALPLSSEFKEANSLLTDDENLDSSQMSTMDLFNVEPVEVNFPFEVNKQISSSIQLSNMTKNYVAFKLMTTDPKNYCVRPNRGVMVPQSTSNITVKKQARKTLPDTESKDKFLVRTAVVSPTTTEKDINWKTFGKEGEGQVKDIKLRVVHTLAPQATFPVAEGSEACTSKGAFMKSNDSSNISQIQESPSCDTQRNLRSFGSIFRMIVDFFGFTSRSYHGYRKIER